MGKLPSKKFFFKAPRAKNTPAVLPVKRREISTAPAERKSERSSREDHRTPDRVYSFNTDDAPTRESFGGFVTGWHLRPKHCCMSVHAGNRPPSSVPPPES